MLRFIHIIFILQSFLSLVAQGSTYVRTKKIDRKAVVERHCPVWNELTGVTTLGNGEFAFNCDATGLQTFAGNTLSNWGWHCYPLPPGVNHEDKKRIPFETHGRIRYYLAPSAPEETELVRWLYDNPHRMNLGRISFRGTNGRAIKSDEINILSRRYDIWTGSVESCFEYKGQQVNVITVCHPNKDAVSVRIESNLLKSRELSVGIIFPYPIPYQKGDFAGNFKQESGHTTVINPTSQASQQILIERTLDDGESYYVELFNLKGLERGSYAPDIQDILKNHTLILQGTTKSDSIAELTVIFSKASVTGKENSDESFTKTKKISADHWKSFWENGGIIDLSGSNDKRWMELERRVILSMFLTAIQSCGSMPPAEAGLQKVDFWCGKFHLEMTAWHGAHFALWGRPHLLDNWSKWFQTTGLESARKEARAEGWEGAKWLKTPDPFGRWESWDHGPNRVTQNAHPFYLAELMWRTDPTMETLLKWKDILFETTEMMLDFVAWDDKRQRYILGPPVMSGAEGNSGFESWNSTSELNYWALSLEISKSWRERLGLPENEKLEHVLTHLSRPPVVNDVYIDAESHPEIWNFSEDGFIRPAWPEVYGCIPGPLIDPQIMERTYEKISEDISSGQWKGNLWGCDYPMLAMTAARLGKPSEAVDWLLFDTPLNEYSPGGYNAGWYLPGNGGLLWAVALMAAGWDDCHIYDEKGNILYAPGFPKDGNWIICYEGINRVP